MCFVFKSVAYSKTGFLNSLHFSVSCSQMWVFLPSSDFSPVGLKVGIRNEQSKLKDTLERQAVFIVQFEKLLMEIEKTPKRFSRWLNDSIWKIAHPAYPKSFNKALKSFLEWTPIGNVELSGEFMVFPFLLGLTWKLVHLHLQAFPEI